MGSERIIMEALHKKGIAFLPGCLPSHPFLLNPPILNDREP